MVAAPGGGDDEIVAATARAGDGPRLVVTADRELRGRVESLGAATVGPRWLTDRTSGAQGSARRQEYHPGGARGGGPAACGWRKPLSTLGFLASGCVLACR